MRAMAVFTLHLTLLLCPGQAFPSQESVTVARWRKQGAAASLPWDRVYPVDRRADGAGCSDGGREVGNLGIFRCCILLVFQY